jgi:integrase/recombinase XerD
MFKNEVYKNNNVRDIAIIELLLNTGIQYNELLALRKEDIEITENTSMIKINKRNQSRMIPLNTVAKKALLLYKNTLIDDNILWLGKASPITRDGINKMIKRYAKKVGISKKITPNSLIQYFASTLAQKNVLDAKTFANILGYKSTNVINRYIEPKQANVQDIIENIYA